MRGTKRGPSNKRPLKKGPFFFFRKGSYFPTIIFPGNMFVFSGGGFYGRKPYNQHPNCPTEVFDFIEQAQNLHRAEGSERCEKN